MGALSIPEEHRDGLTENTNLIMQTPYEQGPLPRPLKLRGLDGDFKPKAP